MYKLEVKPTADRAFKKLTKKDKKQLVQISKKLSRY